MLYFLNSKIETFMITSILEKVGNTPIVSLNVNGFSNLNVFAKLEFCNPTGSVKDRAASYIIRKGFENGFINKDTTLIESSSGNFGVAIAAFAKFNGLKFICVIDKNVSPINETLIKSYGAKVIKIDEPDIFGGYLLNRIKTVKSIVESTPNIYWINQYESTLNAEAYYKSLAEEICDEVPGAGIDYVFMGVSSGGTITGVSQKVKEKYPHAKVIAVDIYGSVIFGGEPSKRLIPGIGSSMRPKILNHARIDDVVWVSEVETVESCRELLKEHFLFAGGSSGSVYAAMKKYFATKIFAKPVNVVCILPDRGERYISTVYNAGWLNMLKESKMMAEEIA
jgi:N-(2-amino-2-carboxyethyl)-L-glutamate synthase